MPITNQRSCSLIAVRRLYVPRPTRSTMGSTTSANTRKSCPKAVAWATRASATIAADTTVRNIEARLKASFQIMLRVASKLQCSVARIWVRTASVTPLRSERGSGGIDGVFMSASLVIPGLYEKAANMRKGGDNWGVPQTPIMGCASPPSPAWAEKRELGDTPKPPDRESPHPQPPLPGGEGALFLWRGWGTPPNPRHGLRPCTP